MSGVFIDETQAQIRQTILEALAVNTLQRVARVEEEKERIEEGTREAATRIVRELLDLLNPETRGKLATLDPADIWQVLWEKRSDSSEPISLESILKILEE